MLSIQPDLRDRVSVRKLLSANSGLDYLGKKVGVAGWIRSTRYGGGGKFAFMDMSDGTSPLKLQVVLNSGSAGYEDIKHAGTAVFAIGEIILSQGKGQKVEMKAEKVVVLGACEPRDYPLAGKGLTLSNLRGQAHLRVRTNVFGAIMRIRNTLAYSTHQFFQEAGFVYVNTPIITTSDCEGAGEMFRVTTLLKDEKLRWPLKEGRVDSAADFFGQPSFLTVSGQLNAESYCMGLSNVYTFGPTFRAENSNTSRHLAEFWMIEPEIAFADLEENMDWAEKYIKHVLHAVLSKNGEDLLVLEQFARDNPKDFKSDKNILTKRLQQVVSSSFARITYTEAIETLAKVVADGKQCFENKVAWGMDLASEHERYLAEQCFGRPTIVTDYPKAIKAFYMRQNDDGKTVRAMDILVPGIGELVGGSQREERLDVLLNALQEVHLKESDYRWYLDLRRFGSVPHSGFGLGFERLVCFATGMKNIRDAIPFPRTPGSADF